MDIELELSVTNVNIKLGCCSLFCAVCGPVWTAVQLTNLSGEIQATC